MDREPAIPKTEGIVWDGISHNFSHFFVIARHRKFYSEKHLAEGITALEELRNTTIDNSRIEKIDALLTKLRPINTNSAVDLSLIKEIQDDLGEIKTHK